MCTLSADPERAPSPQAATDTALLRIKSEAPSLATTLAEAMWLFLEGFQSA